MKSQHFSLQTAKNLFSCPVYFCSHLNVIRDLSIKTHWLSKFLKNLLKSRRVAAKVEVVLKSVKTSLLKIAKLQLYD